MHSDYIFRRSHIHTHDQKLPTTQTLAVLGSEIIALGSDADSAGMIGI